MRFLNKCHKGYPDLNQCLIQTNFRECYICQEAKVLLVLLKGLCLDNDVVGDVTVATPADEGSPVIVQAAMVQLLTVFGTFSRDNF